MASQSSVDLTTTAANNNNNNNKILLWCRSIFIKPAQPPSENTQHTCPALALQTHIPPRKPFTYPGHRPPRSALQSPGLLPAWRGLVGLFVPWSSWSESWLRKKGFESKNLCHPSLVCGAQGASNL